jgi:tRNA threonylcarbamoyladenosine biosynthesis protein TsaB
MVEATMAAAGLGYRALDAIAVTRGPGTFTGLRIGLAAARGLALAARRPLVGLTTLEVLAAGVPEAVRGRAVVAAMEARRGEVYAQAFSPLLRPLGAAEAVAPEALAGRLPQGPLVIAGDGAPRLAALLGARATVAPGDGLPDAAVAARLAATRPLPPPGTPVPPLYLRPPDARLPRARPLARGRRD